MKKHSLAHPKLILRTKFHALKEMRESNYWIRILIATSDSNEKLLEQLVHLKNESEELKEILGKIVVSSREAKH